MNTIHLHKTSQLPQKIYIFLCIGPEFRSHNCFYPLLLFTLVFLPSIHFLCHFTLWHGLVYNFTIWEQLVQRRKNPVTNCVVQRENKWNSTSGRKGRRQATETEWNFSAFFYIQNVSKDNSFLLPSEFLYPLFIKIIFEQPFGNQIVKASRLNYGINKTHVKSFENTNRETQSIRENSGSANCKTFLKILTTSEHSDCYGNI